MSNVTVNSAQHIKLEIVNNIWLFTHRKIICVLLFECAVQKINLWNAKKIILIQCFYIKLEWQSVSFSGGREMGEPREKPLEQVKNPGASQESRKISTQLWVKHSSLGHIARRWVLLAALGRTLGVKVLANSLPLLTQIY